MSNIIRIKGGPHPYEILVEDAETGERMPGIIERIDILPVRPDDDMVRARLTFVNVKLDLKAEWYTAAAGDVSDSEVNSS